MTNHPYLRQGLSILQAELQSTQPHPEHSVFSSTPPFLTISRETCAGASTLGQCLLPLLNTHFARTGRSWMFLDKDLLKRTLTRHHLPEDLAKFLPEDRLPEIEGLIGEMIGLHPPLWELENLVTESILNFARQGNVIFTGRAANLITRHLAGGFHLRLVASLKSRIDRSQEIHQCSREIAESILEESDLARQRYVQTHFAEHINNPHLYDLVINTDTIAPATAAQIVLTAMQKRLARPS